MVPVRVHLSGFLTYREPVTFDFEKSDLWLLWGRNGVGKSSVFDAITFALFGRGRFGGNIVADYVNHRCADMLVEFDFDLGTDRWRVRRTARQNGGGGTYEVFSVNRDTGSAEIVGGTNTRAGFQQWMDDNFPLNFDSFRAAALLQQGHADVLLDANAEMRRQFMDKIVDLRAYTNFHKDISKQATTKKNEVDGLNLRMEKVAEETRGKMSALITALNLQAQMYPVTQTWATAVLLGRRIDEIHREAEAELIDITAARDGVTTLIPLLEQQANAVIARAEAVIRKAEYADILARDKEIEARAARLVLLKAAIPHVEGFLNARTGWRAWVVKADKARQQIAAAIKDIERLTREHGDAEERLAAARVVLTDAQARLTEAKTRLKALKERAKQLSGNEGKAECQVCGQALTPEQVERERVRLEAGIGAAEKTMQEAQDAADTAARTVTAAEAYLRGVQADLRTAEERRVKAESNLRQAEQGTTNEQEKAAQSCRFLASVTDAPTIGTWAQALLPAASDDNSLLPLLRDSDRPGDNDIVDLKNEAKELAVADEEKRRLDEARVEASKQDAIIAAQDSLIRAADDALAPREQDKGRLVAVRDRLQGKRRETAQAVLAEETKVLAAPDTKTRRDAGSAGIKRIRTIAAAPQEAADKERTALATEETETRERSQTAREGASRLKELMAAYDDLLTDHDRVAYEYLIHKTLAGHLHEGGLPSRLRADAEGAIVANADVILQRLSGGSLHVECRVDSGEALDIQVRDREKTDRPLRPAALSGSQRFRLAVALALGIGQYACRTHAGGVESVIVDEGFGSLDREGREKMIEELNRLSGILKRVIVVSHQDEFENAFANQWRISLEDGAARATLYP